MRTWAGRVVVAGGLVANAIVIPHPLGLAAAQVVLAAVVLSGRGGAVVLAGSALVLVPAPIAEVRRWLSHAPLACACQRTLGRPGWWPVVGTVADAGLIGLTVALARMGSRDSAAQLQRRPPATRK